MEKITTKTMVIFCITEAKATLNLLTVPATALKPVMNTRPKTKAKGNQFLLVKSAGIGKLPSDTQALIMQVK